MKYYGGCDVGSTYTKAVILDEDGKMVADTTIKSKINSEASARLAMDEVLGKVGLKSSKDLAYLIGTGYGRNKVPFADENISEISCHAMGVHVTDPSVKAIIDIGGQDVKGIAVDTDGTVKNFAMNDKCAAGTGRFLDVMARVLEVSVSDMEELGMQSTKEAEISPTCTVFAESSVISLLAAGSDKKDIITSTEIANNPDYKIGVQIGSIQADLAKEFTPNADIVELSKVTDIVMELSTGKLDAAFIETPVVQAYSNTYKNLEIACVIPQDDNGSVIGVYKGNADLLKYVNEAINKCISDGTFAQYVAKAVDLAAGDIHQGLLDENGKVPTTSGN